MRLTVCSPPWSCLQSWTSSRMPTLPDLERGGGHRKGEEDGPDPTPPQAGPMAVTAPLPVKKGYGKCGMVQSSILLLSLLWDLLSGGTPKVSFLMGMVPCCCLSCLGHLAALPWNTWRCHGCRHPENTALGVPQLPCHHGGGGSLPKAIFGIPLLHGRCHHN